jgi:hypothetical protein
MSEMGHTAGIAKGRKPHSAEHQCLAEEKWSEMALFLPSSTNLPPK